MRGNAGAEPAASIDLGRQTQAADSTLPVTLVRRDLLRTLRAVRHKHVSEGAQKNGPLLPASQSGTGCVLNLWQLDTVARAEHCDGATNIQQMPAGRFMAAVLCLLGIVQCFVQGPSASKIQQRADVISPDLCCFNSNNIQTTSLILAVAIAPPSPPGAMCREPPTGTDDSEKLCLVHGNVAEWRSCARRRPAHGRALQSRCRLTHLRPPLQRRVGAVLPVHRELPHRGLHGAQAVRDVLAPAQRHAQAAVVRVLEVLRVLVVKPESICKDGHVSRSSGVWS